MTLLEIFLIGIGLSMDAFAVAICSTETPVDAASDTRFFSSKYRLTTSSGLRSFHTALDTQRSFSAFMPLAL